ncbi:MAG: hypothetical protein ACRCZ2_08780 [Fusobacteriaceae bacterium]
MLTLKEACLQVKEFETLANILKQEMEKKAFRSGSDFETMKIKYEFLGEITNIIANETIQPDETSKENKE